MSILVLGADGYIGWSLTCHLAASVREPIIAVDDGSKRRRVSEEGFASAIPILSFEDRVQALGRATQRTDIQGIHGEVSKCIVDLVKEFRPSTVVHLAQIPSAPYSMQSFAKAQETLINNEVGNLALLFALRDHAPDAHLVKMGSMGEYAKCGVPIGEGYVHAVLDGDEADQKIPYPRGADDIYHITKINDSNFVAMAARVWGLAATDVMQSVVYGVRSRLARSHPELATRFDCDPVFGSVLNRFVSQAVQELPLTVYGGGLGTTGLIALEDVLSALTYWIRHPAGKGEHRVINQTTETRVTVLEVAKTVQRLAADRGKRCDLFDGFDPRYERERPSKIVPIRNHRLRQTGIPLVGLEQGVGHLLDDLMPHAKALPAAGRGPTVDWKGGAPRG